MANTLTPFRRAQGTDDIEKRFEFLQHNLELCLQFITKADILDGRIIEAIDLISGDVTVRHNLGRVPNGLIVTSKNIVGNVPYIKSSDEQEMVLTAGASETVNVWVF
jgi:hypothetical protein